MKDLTNKLVTHLPAIVLVVVAVLNVLIKDNSLHMSDSWADVLNVLLGAIGVAGHINNHK